MADKQQYFVYTTAAASFDMDSSHDTIYNNVAEIIADATDPINYYNTYMVLIKVLLVKY